MKTKKTTLDKIAQVVILIVFAALLITLVTLAILQPELNFNL